MRLIAMNLASGKEGHTYLSNFAVAARSEAIEEGNEILGWIATPPPGETKGDMLAGAPDLMISAQLDGEVIRDNGVDGKSRYSG